MTTHKEAVDELDEILTPLFIQARQEALKEAYDIPPNRNGVVTSTPSKVAHLVNDAKLSSLIAKAEVDARIDELDNHVRLMNGWHVGDWDEAIKDRIKALNEPKEEKA